VTVVEVLDRILPVEDEEISKEAARAFKKRGIRILTGAKIGKTDISGKGAKIEVTVGGKSEMLEAEKVISAVGIVGNVENLGLEKAGVKVEKSYVVVNEWLETGVKGLYAIGDLAGPPWLAHKASHEGVIAAERIAGVKGLHPMNTGRIPGCTYSSPQIASVGMTEARAKEKGHEVKVGRFPFKANGKAIALGETGGFVKTVFDAKTGELLGAHMIGPEVTELIQGYGIAMSLETTEAELMHTIFPHPTLSEAMHEAVLDAYGRVLHT
jgi:dihydrolipoamide dehydrogenase